MSRIAFIVLIAQALLLPSPAKTLPAIAYLHRDASYWQAWVMNPDGSDARAVTTSPSEKTRVSWFPDGKTLLVSTERGEALRVDVASGREEKLAVPLTGTMDAVVSPNGKQVAFSVSPAHSRDDHEVYLVNLDGTGLRQLTNERGVQDEPAWDPGGRLLYFVSHAQDEAHDVWRIALPKGDLEQVTHGRRLHFHVAVGPGGALAYSNNFTGNYEVWVQRPGEPPRAITDDPAVDGFPAWSPDGRELLFESSRSGQLEIWRVGVGGGGATQVTTTPAGAQHPVWFTPAGKAAR